MSRILLGVSGGIAAYKALELVRLATAAGHALRVVQTPASRRFVGAASFEALTGAPTLASEFERDPARGAFPGQPLPEHEPLSHLQLVANADVYAIAPASANTLAKLANGLARQPAEQLCAGGCLPARAGARDEQPDVRAPGHPGQPTDAARPRRGRARARRRAAGRQGRAGHRSAGRAGADPHRVRGGAGGNARCGRALARDQGARHRRRHARADRQRQVPRQQLLRAHGPRTRARGTRAGGPGDRGRGQRRARPSRGRGVARGLDGRGAKGRVRAGVPRRATCC